MVLVRDLSDHLHRLHEFWNGNNDVAFHIAGAIDRISSTGFHGFTRIERLASVRKFSSYRRSKYCYKRNGRLKAMKRNYLRLRQEVFDRESISNDDEKTKVWKHIAKKLIPKAARQLIANFQTKILNLKRTIGFCARETKKLWTRQGRLQKEFSTRAKRQMRDMILFWRKNEKEEKDLRKKAEKEAAEQRRLEEEQREAKRQAKKLNFLLTQTELFSHFVAGKAVSNSATANYQNINEALPIGIDFAEVDDDLLSAQARKLALQAAERTKKERDSYDDEHLDFSKAEYSQSVSQPRMLQAQLKEYQLAGLSWMANLYEQGINGILADEMGLGKTIQAISLLGHLAETHNIWGPFLIVAPASTLHNWQQELARFVPSFKILPYWGNVTDRKTLRKFWPSSAKRALTRDSMFHIMVTSYQLVVTDRDFLQKNRWQYMILDEAQAIKSSSSQRWNALLSFPCRNRLLLTGTPIQNSMQELWALLHFIMPTLFDSHDEFSDWFAKDIEYKAADSSSKSAGFGGFDQHQLARLHMILKPFMLRRVKKDVQSELAPKIEIQLLCEFSPKQKRMYRGIKQRLPIVELLKCIESDSDATSSLMNIMMQFRKVCNHPELFERETIHSPYIFTNLADTVYEQGLEKVIYWTGVMMNPIQSEFFRNDVLAEDCEKVKLSLRRNDYSDLIVRIKETDPFDDFIPISIDYLKTKTQTFSPRVLANQPDLSDFLDYGLPRISPTSDYAIGTHIQAPDFTKCISDCGKMLVLDGLLSNLFKEGHRVLIYNQMTKMIDLMEEYLQFRKYRYLRLDGSTRISDRRDMVNSWQNDTSIFVFLLSTRAGGLGINLTAADTVIFYDSDWNPTVDQQAMDRAHRLGQQKQVTVYRLITKGSVEERIQQRAHQKDLVHKIVIAGGDFTAQDTSGFKARDIASLLLEESDSE